jgi:hypothetical protein
VGSRQIIHQGDVNWMVAGRGITHSERTPAEARKRPHTGYGLQTWVALPEADEDTAPSFEHHAKTTLPVIESEGVRLRLILGRAYGEAAPARVFSETFYADAELEPGARMPLPDDHEERGVYILEGSVSVAGQSFEAGQLMVFRPKDRISVAAEPKGARLILLGGATLTGPRYIWWNFVASSRGRSTPPRSNGARATGAADSSTFRPTIAMNSFRCPPDRENRKQILPFFRIVDYDGGEDEVGLRRRVAPSAKRRKQRNETGLKSLKTNDCGKPAVSWPNDFNDLQPQERNRSFRSAKRALRFDYAARPARNASTVSMTPRSSAKPFKRPTNE